AQQRPSHTHTRASLRQSSSASLAARHKAHYPISLSFSCFVVALCAVIYSYLNALVGSTLSARRAGTKDASKVTIVNRTGIAAKVIGSVTVTPNTKVTR